VEQAIQVNADLIIAHHPLLLRPVSSVAPTTYKGRIVHQLIRAGTALYAAHTNADNAQPGVSDALAQLLNLVDLRPLHPLGAATQPGSEGERSPAGTTVKAGGGRIGRLATPTTLGEFARNVAAALPPTTWGIRVSGDPRQPVETVAICGGAGDSYLADATAAQVDVYLTADLRHHPVSETVSEAGPALIDAAHWATEHPWLNQLAPQLRNAFPEVEIMVSELVTDPWTTQLSSPGNQCEQIDKAHHKPPNQAKEFST
jgi:dinuclear metal center YbgI/SA1388 family protein